MSGLLPLDDALVQLRKIVKPICGHENCLLEDALNRVTASAIDAPYALPPFTNTGVDGYAFTHINPAPIFFNLAGTSFAGEPFTDALPTGSAVRIATGAVLPEGADTVVMQEQCRVDGNQLFINTMPAAGANIRPAGADIRRGAQALPAGRRLQPQDIALLGALGMTTVRVRRPLKILIASTGHELNTPGTALGPGQIIDTNSLMLRQLLQNYAPAITTLPHLADDYDATRTALTDAAAHHDMIITTGGVSVGDRDFVGDVLRDAGQIHFWKLAIRPGRPLMFGQIGDCLMMGLPGNPVSAFVTFFLMVAPLIRYLYGMPPDVFTGYPLPLAEDLSKNKGLRSFSRANLEYHADMLQVRSYPDQSSNLITSLTASDGLIDLPADSENFKAGEKVLFRPYHGLL